MSFWKWSRTAASNGAADSTCPFPEGMAPSALNDGARGMMAAAAKYRDDVAGLNATGGTSTFYTLTSFQGFDTFANMHGASIAFAPHITNGDTVVINVDGLGNRPLRPSPGVELVAGTLIQGTPYRATYNNVDVCWYLYAYYSSPYNVPFLGGMDFWDTVTPNSSFILPQGQAISRTVYARAFARWGTQFGVGNGTTTFNVPDKVGRVSAMLDLGSARLSAGYFGGNPANLGAVGGSESHTLTTPQIPSHTHANTLTDPGHTHSINVGSSGGGQAATQGINTTPVNANNSATTGITITNAAAGGGGAHNNVQPTIVCNYIIRII